MSFLSKPRDSVTMMDEEVVRLIDEDIVENDLGDHSEDSAEDPEDILIIDADDEEFELFSDVAKQIVHQVCLESMISLELIESESEVPAPLVAELQPAMDKAHEVAPLSPLLDEVRPSPALIEGQSSRASIKLESSSREGAKQDVESCSRPPTRPFLTLQQLLTWPDGPPAEMLQKLRKPWDYVPDGEEEVLPPPAEAEDSLAELLPGLKEFLAEEKEQEASEVPLNAPASGADDLLSDEVAEDMSSKQTDGTPLDGDARSQSSPSQKSGSELKDAGCLQGTLRCQHGLTWHSSSSSPGPMGPRQPCSRSFESRGTTTRKRRLWHRIQAAPRQAPLHGFLARLPRGKEGTSKKQLAGRWAQTARARRSCAGVGYEFLPWLSGVQCPGLPLRRSVGVWLLFLLHERK